MKKNNLFKSREINSFNALRLSKIIQLIVLLILMPALCVYADDSNSQKFNDGSGLLLQQKNVTGKVTDETGGPLPGVTILIKGTSRGTITNSKGEYSLANVPDDATLVFSFIGMQSQEIIVGNQTTINISMKASSINIDEVVSIGYGKQSRQTISTSVSKLDNKVIENIPYLNSASALKGTIAGVRVQTTSGQPGATPRIIIRGGTSINNPNGATPLYVIDGVLRSDMDNIAVDDIESIQVLKDAASTSIYGARGSNGVVLITTKSGKAGRMKINFRYDLTISEVGKRLELANARDYLTLSRKGMINPHGLPDETWRLTSSSGFGTGNDLTKNTMFTTQYLTDENRYKLDEGWESMPDPVDPSKTLIFKDTDWQDVLFRTAISHNYHLSFSGGSDKATINSSIGYSDAEGTVITTDYKRLNLGLNGDLKFNDKFSVFGRVMYSHTVDNQVPSISTTFARYITAPPTMKYRFEDGTLAGGTKFNEGNPEYILNLYDRETAGDDMTFSTGFHWKIIPGLSFDPQLSFYSRNRDFHSFLPAYQDGPGKINTTRTAVGSNDKYRTTQFDAVFSYKKHFGSFHNLDATAGSSYILRKISNLYARGEGAATDLIPTLNASAVPVKVSSYISERALLGYFARVNYNYKYKYLFTFNMRYDGASNLGDNYKWGFFPGVSVGWNLHNEDFWSVLPENLLHFKLRASYGINGNISGLGDFAAQGEYSIGQPYFGRSSIQNTVLPNQDLQWEESKTFDVGADIGLFNRRINLIVDYYIKTTDNLITNLALPPSTGFGSILTNLGTLQNKGFELELNAQVLPKTSGFQWNIALNVAYVKNKILKLPENGTENNRVGGYYVWDANINDYAWKGGLQEGGTMGDMYGYHVLGIFATDAEAQADGVPVDMIKTTSDKMNFGGDANWQDSDGNGIIDSRDKVFIGNIYPDWTGGFSSSFSFKGFDLSVRFDFMTGHSIWNFLGGFMDGGWKLNMNMQQSMVKDSWKEQGDIASKPWYGWDSTRKQWNIAGINDNLRRSDLYTVPGDFLSIREMTFSYNFSSRVLNKIKLSNLRLYFTGSNLYYFTSYTGQNPEEGGRDYGRYPIPKNYTFGLNISF